MRRVTSLVCAGLAYAEISGRKDCLARPEDFDLQVKVTQNQVWVPQLPDFGYAIGDETWSPDLKPTRAYPLQVTNTAPVFPCRTPRDVCRNAVNGMPVPYNAPGQCQGDVPPVAAGPATRVAPVSTALPNPDKQAGSTAIAPEAGPPASAGGSLTISGQRGRCDVPGKYACIGAEPSVCDLQGSTC